MQVEAAVMPPDTDAGQQYLAVAARNLLTDLNLFQPASIAPVSIPRIIFDYAREDSGQSDIGGMLDALSLLIAYEGVSEKVISRFWSICPDLIARWLDADNVAEAVWEARLVTVASICSSMEGAWRFILAFLDRSPFASSPLALHTDPEAPAPRLQRLLLAYYRLLVADPGLSRRSRWNDQPLIALRTHPDLGVRLLALRVLSMQNGWSESKRLKLETEWVGDVATQEVEVAYAHDVFLTENGFEVQERRVSGWVLPIHEMNRLAHLVSIDRTTLPTTLGGHLSPYTVMIAGLPFYRSPSTPLPFLHVATTATEAALSSLAPHLRSGLPILLSSPPSAGKSHLLQYLSSLCHPGLLPSRQILSIPLADTTIDVKSLIGTYVSSPTKPGTFEWMEGALAKAVRAGRWVVLDDIDRASTEMLVTVMEIARSLKASVPGRRARLVVTGREQIEAGLGFRLFATRSTRGDAAFMGHHFFREVTLDPPTEADITTILEAQFPRLPNTLIPTLVTIWGELRDLSLAGKARDIGLRDLEKWCSRVQHDLPQHLDSMTPLLAHPVFQEEVLLEAVDVLMASLDGRGTTRRDRMIDVVATAIGLDNERALALVDRRRPNLEFAAKQLIIGRTSTPLAAKKRSSRPFALTRPSLVLLERIAASARMGEPTLLVGETGTGKTTAVQYIADACGKTLTALNLSMQTESSDLLGGFKPVDASVTARLLHARWQQLFLETFSMAKAQNTAYIEAAGKALSGRKWGRCTDLWSTSARRALEKLGRGESNGNESPAKRRRPNIRAAKAAVQWQSLMVEIADFDLHHVKVSSKLVFAFIEGPLVKAMRDGEWILLDEINLASHETLEAIATILEGPTASLVLTDRGDVEPVTRHPDFRLFACMNPATDVGKKDLPPSLRSRFTEFYVPAPDSDREALVAIVTQYIGDVAAGDRAAILDIAEMYLELKRLSATKEIVDGANIAPHYSMRTLARALMFAVETACFFGLRRGLWEGVLMAFTMSLDLASMEKAREVCSRRILGPMKNARAVLAQIPSLPQGTDADNFIRFGPFWLTRGPLAVTTESRYIITPSVQAKLSDLARVILTHKYPVLIQGPTSSGKTSAIEFLAQQTGHRFVRINNHEHTDIQEYLGTYVTDPESGNLVFQEGLLVTAVREGHWIVLDELNLAPTDVLEALNRLLDDNRELVIPETQEIVKPHPNFILFATQNPPGLYAGRKVLSRAFRNRFLEVHFDDVPKNELETILCQRCQIAPSYAKKIVQVFEELRHRRQASRVFESKSSFATLRDLFRWAERKAVGYQQLADDGYMLLAERGRQSEDKEVIRQVIEDVMKVTVTGSMYTDLARLPFSAIPQSGLVWTQAMQRLFTLVAVALQHGEPVLLVGETGCGKTSVCDVIAAAFKQSLVGVNCHQNMETADLLGSQRPVRNRLERRAKMLARLDAPVTSSDEELLAICDRLPDRAEAAACRQDLVQLSALFEWSDGPLVHAMRKGDLLLLDEVSLADDSVLERLNSVLEPGRTLVLAEKGGDIDSATIVADPNFHVVATMNPGGDFGKKELSPALRNRFTEIWVPPLDDRNDLLQIVDLSWKHTSLKSYSSRILDFFDWFGKRVGNSGMGLRDILAWVTFMDDVVSNGIVNDIEAFRHGGQMTVVDGLESLPCCTGMSVQAIQDLRLECLSRLGTGSGGSVRFTVSDEHVCLGGFPIRKGTALVSNPNFHFEAPTTALNAMRVFRGCQLPKAILLEGSPGVGKTSLVTALAAITHHHLQRINLSDQTDLIDLFGTDLPVEGGRVGEFQWRDAAFLDAMQKGDWVLLDEMNLASQTVLEGLNAVLDYRGTVYIPELGRSFVRHPDFRIFAAQNPLQQGGGRKGLPKSFLNRFTKVYLQEHTAADLLAICRSSSMISESQISKMIQFNEEMRIATSVTREIGRDGSPWEFNLRDLFRWFGVLSAKNGLELEDHPAEFLEMIYLQRFRTAADRHAARRIFDGIFGIRTQHVRPQPLLHPLRVQVSHSGLEREDEAGVTAPLAYHHLHTAQAVMKALEMGWLVILAGDAASGKRTLVEAISQRAGRSLSSFAMHPGVDTSEILGSFEQQDPIRLAKDALLMLQSLGLPQLEDLCQQFAAGDVTAEDLLGQLHSAQQQSPPHAHLIQRAVDAVLNIGRTTGFAWVDGQLIHALKNGGWFLISNANLCSPSVLDRLNSLCETNGTITLSEKGSAHGTPEIIRPHPDFRLLMTYDPRHGELSRAMRNRGIELYVDKVKADLESPILPNDSLLVPASYLQITAIDKPTFVANAVALSPRDSTRYLSRFWPADTLISTALEYALYPRPSTSNPRQAIQLVDTCLSSAQGRGSVFASLAVLLRLSVDENSLTQWLSTAAGQKSILNPSAVALRNRKGRVHVDAYSILKRLRDTCRDLAIAVLRGSGDEARLDSVNDLQHLAWHLEQRSRGALVDYSAYGILLRWIVEELLVVQADSELIRMIESSFSLVEPKDGPAQTVIWAAWREHVQMSSLLPSDLISKVDACSDSNLRAKFLQCLILIQRRNVSEDEIADVHGLIGNLPAEISPAYQLWPDNGLSTAMEIQAWTAGQQTRSKISDFLLGNSRIRVHELAVLHVAWDAADHNGSNLFNSVSQQLDRMWQLSSPATNQPDAPSIFGGPAGLFGPLSLSAVLRFQCVDDLPAYQVSTEVLSRSRMTRLHDLVAGDKALTSSVQAILLQTRVSSTRLSSLAHLLMAMAKQLLGIIAPVQSSIGTGFASTQQLSIQADSIQDQALRSTVQRFASNVPSTCASLRDLGMMYVNTGRFLLDLFVTDIPMDPAVRSILIREVAMTRLAQLEEELEAIEEGERYMKGIGDSPRRDRAKHAVDVAEKEIAALGSPPEARLDPSLLAHLFSEVHSFLADIASEQTVAQVIDALQRGDPQAFARENAFQLATEAIIGRLTNVYIDYADLTQPIIFALRLIRFGVRCFARDSELASKVPDLLFTAAVRFPSVEGFSSLTKPPTARTAILGSVARGLDNSHYARRSSGLIDLLDLLQGVYQMWSDARSREQRDQQANDSLYRVRKVENDVLSEQEQEEKEFAEMFPQYNENDSPVQSDPEEVERAFGKVDVERFHSIITTIFAEDDLLSSLLGEMKDSIASVFDPSAYDEKLDRTSLAFQIDILHRRTALRRRTAREVNFYLDSNEFEVRKAAELLARLQARLRVLMSEWPEQMVLQHIQERCDKFEQLDIQSPMAMVLASLEQLLVHIDDWEPYAYKGNSLKSFQTEMSALIIEWRKLELASWVRLLDDQARQYTVSDREWTIRLYGTLITAPQNVHDAVPLVITLLQGSTLGNYDSRIQVLRAYEELAKRALDAGLDQYSTVFSALHHVLANISLFVPRIHETLKTQRATIDKAIRDYVKLASWKDVNVFALKAAAQKSHRQLHKNVRKFREVLQQPIAPFLTDIGAIASQLDSASSPPTQVPSTEVSPLPSTLPVAPANYVPSAVLVRLPDILHRYLKLHQDFSATTERLGEHLDEMAVDIINTAAELSKATPPFLTKENTKVVANLATRKRKAFADLLKALRATGFSPNLRADYLGRQKSQMWLLSRPVLLTDLPPAVERSCVNKICDYDARLGALIPAMRAALTGHSPDIASPDLQRGMGFVESVYSVALTERDRLATQLEKLRSFAGRVDRLRQLSTASSLTSSAGVLQQMDEARATVSKVEAAMQEMVEAIQKHRELEQQPALTDITWIQTAMSEFGEARTALDDVIHSVSRSGCDLISEAEHAALRTAAALNNKIKGDITKNRQSQPEFSYLYDPVLDWLSRQQISSFEPTTDANVSPLVPESDEIIQALLVVSQGLSRQEAPEADQTVSKGFTESLERIRSLRVDEVVTRLDALLSKLSASLSHQTSSDGPLLLGRLLPFVEGLISSYGTTLGQYAQDIKCTYKLCYVVARLMLDLAQKGFCKPPEESEPKDDGKDGEAAEGTGMGAGTGDKNVSSEIEEESQVEGMKGEKEEEHEQGDKGEDKKGEDDAVEMEDDFEGALEDREDKEAGEEEDGDEEEGDHDEHAGDVDPLDPGAVDEKFWGDDEKEDKQDQGGEELMDQKTKDEGGEAEMSAKEKESKGKPPQKPEEGEEQAKENQGETADDAAETQDQDMDDSPDEMDTQSEQDQDQQDGPARPDEQNVNVPEGDALDLPEDLQLDDVEGGSDLDPEDDMTLPPDDTPEEEGGEADDASVAGDDDGQEVEQGPDATGVGEEDVFDQEENMGQNLDTSAANDAHAADTAGAGGGGGAAEDAQKPNAAEEEKEAENGAEEKRRDEMDAGGQGDMNQDSTAAADPNSAEGQIDSTGARLPADSSTGPQANRSLGNILEEIRRRQDEILAQQEREREVAEGQDANTEAPGQVEYLHDGQKDEGQQALGVAGDETQKLEDLNIVDEEEQGRDGDVAMEDGEIDEDKAPGETGGQTGSKKEQSDMGQMPSEKALTRAEINGTREHGGASNEAAADVESCTVEADMDEVKSEAGRDEAEAQLVIAAAEAQSEDGRAQWRHYASITSDLSYALCEQLRLILEPTLATRLQGDFRTGKRLNMRKIIPYIASEYTKDKIWLRRTKPSRREYQVLLSLDDSRSMAESHSVDLAYQTLALVAQALNKLEVGQIGIAKFGETVDILHEFGDAGFNDSDGAKVMQSFTFNQQKTDVATLVSRTLSFLAESRQKQASASAPDLWQLQIIISDGVCQDHDRLRTLLRRALEERVMIVFLVIDSLQAAGDRNSASASTSTAVSAPGRAQRPSILSMQTVEYKNVGGEMQLEMTRYLDTFPFEYYVVLRDVEALPGVLADTLRQWMTRVSQSQE